MLCRSVETTLIKRAGGGFEPTPALILLGAKRHEDTIHAPFLFCYSGLLPDTYPLENGLHVVIPKDLCSKYANCFRNVTLEVVNASEENSNEETDSKKE